MEKAKDLLLTTGKLALKVTPRASRAAVEGWVDDANGAPVLKVKVTVVAEDGKANEAVIALLAKEFGIAKSRLSIARGLTNRNKVIALDA
jgi:uncharacterized protein YggU (UPF0235/DUF167 family)